MPPRRKAADPSSVILYVRVSTEEQRESGLGLDAQRAKLLAEAKHREWSVVHIAEDQGYSAKTIKGRPNMIDALERLERGEAANFCATKLDRLSRSVMDFTGLLDQSVRQAWNLVVLDLGIDTSTPNGKFMAHILASVAQLEREIIGERTSDALQEKKRQGATLGRPDRTRPEVVARVVALRAADTPLRAIAAQLNADEVSPAQGGVRWYASTVAAVLNRADARAALALTA